MLPNHEKVRQRPAATSSSNNDLHKAGMWCIIYTMKTTQPAKNAMRRTNMYFSAPQMEELTAMSASTGLSIAELVRRAVDAYLATARKKKELK